MKLNATELRASLATLALVIIAITLVMGVALYGPVSPTGAPLFGGPYSPQRLTNVHEGVSELAWSPDASRLALVATVAEEAVDNEGDDLRAAVHGDDDVLRLAGLDGAFVAVPGRFAATVVERDLERAGVGGGDEDAFAGFVAAVEDGLAGLERVELEPEVEAEAGARVPATVVGALGVAEV